MKTLDISLRVWYAESMEFTEQELAVISYGLEDHITELNKNLQAIDDVARNGLGNDLVGDLRRMHTQARNETRALLAKVEGMLYGTK